MNADTKAKREITQLSFDANTLIPVVVQNAHTGRVLMQAFGNEESLQKTHTTGYAHFWSRRRNRLWKKGETSGNTLRVLGTQVDCDRDSVLYIVKPTGNTCHTGAESCFFRGDDVQTNGEFLDTLEQTIAKRQIAEEKGSYVSSLFAAGLDRIAQKVGEEGVEVVISAKNNDREDFLNESADLLFHLLVLLRAKDVCLADVLAVLRERQKGK